MLPEELPELLPLPLDVLPEELLPLPLDVLPEELPELLPLPFPPEELPVPPSPKFVVVLLEQPIA